ncbi:hypothetical protein KIPB_012538, partial [Kipferlia bialata]
GATCRIRQHVSALPPAPLHHPDDLSDGETHGVPQARQTYGTQGQTQGLYKGSTGMQSTGLPPAQPNPYTSLPQQQYSGAYTPGQSTMDTGPSQGGYGQGQLPPRPTQTQRPAPTIADLYQHTGGDQTTSLAQRQIETVLLR